MDGLRREERGWRAALVRVAGGAAPVLIALLLVATGAALLTPATYRVPTGTVDFQLRPAWPGGRLVLPLGPAGVLSLRTHRVPVDVVVDYRVSAEVSSLEEAERVVEGLPAVERSARAAFVRFLWSRLGPLLVLGACAGALVAGAGRRGLRALVAGAGAGVAVAGVGGFALAGLALATVDQRPPVEYSGLARNVSRLLPLVRQLHAADGRGMERLEAHLDGLEIVAAQLAGEGAPPPRERVTRLLVVSDVHMNAYGASVASTLAAGEGTPVDAVVLAGDMTNLGRKLEADLFVDSFDSASAPVIMVGGNHEDTPAMRAFTEAGYDVLEYTGAHVGAVVVYGVSDPLAYSPAVDSDIATLGRQSAELQRRVAALPRPPDVLAVHDVRQAEAVVDWAVAGDVPLTVVYGNSHVPAIERRGPVTLIDAGTAGASGYEQIGARRGDWYTFVLLDFPREGGGLLAVTTLAYSVDGRSRVEYLPVTP